MEMPTEDGASPTTVTESVIDDLRASALEEDDGFGGNSSIEDKNESAQPLGFHCLSTETMWTTTDEEVCAVTNLFDSPIDVVKKPETVETPLTVGKLPLTDILEPMPKTPNVFVQLSLSTTPVDPSVVYLVGEETHETVTHETHQTPQPPTVTVVQEDDGIVVNDEGRSEEDKDIGGILNNITEVMQNLSGLSEETLNRDEVGESTPITHQTPTLALTMVADGVEVEGGKTIAGLDNSTEVLITHSSLNEDTPNREDQGLQGSVASTPASLKKARSKHRVRRLDFSCLENPPILQIESAVVEKPLRVVEVGSKARPSPLPRRSPRSSKPTIKAKAPPKFKKGQDPNRRMKRPIRRRPMSAEATLGFVKFREEAATGYLNVDPLNPPEWLNHKLAKQYEEMDEDHRKIIEDQALLEYEAREKKRQREEPSPDSDEEEGEVEEEEAGEEDVCGEKEAENDDESTDDDTQYEVRPRSRNNPQVERPVPVDGPNTGNSKSAWLRYKNQRLAFYKETVLNEPVRLPVSGDINNLVRNEWLSMKDDAKQPYNDGAMAERAWRKAVGILPLKRKNAQGKKKGQSAAKKLKTEPTTWQSYMSLPTIISFFRELTDAQRTYMYDIGLGALEHLRIKQTKDEMNKFLYHSYDPEGYFSAHGRTVEITDEMVGDLLGISCHGEILEPDETNMENSRLAISIGLTTGNVGIKKYREWFSKPENKYLLSNEWKLRAVVLVLACVGLIVTRQTVRRQLALYVTDLAGLSKVNWAGTWLAHLKKQQEPFKLGECKRGGGCLLIPLLVYLEHFCPKYSDNPPLEINGHKAVPRLRFWTHEMVSKRWKLVSTRLDEVELKTAKIPMNEKMPQQIDPVAIFMEKIVDQLRNQGWFEKIRESEKCNKEGVRTPQEPKAQKPHQEGTQKEESGGDNDVPQSTERAQKSLPWQSRKSVQGEEVNSPHKIERDENGNILSEKHTRAASNMPPPANRYFHVRGSPKMPPAPRVYNTPPAKNQSGRVYNRQADGMRLPRAPSVKECWIHYWMTHVDEEESKRRDCGRDIVVGVKGFVHIARDKAWQMSKKHWFGDGMLDCMARILLELEFEKPRHDKKIWYLPSYFSVIDQNSFSLGFGKDWLGEWAQMEMIALPINITHHHYFLMVLCFTSKKVHVLDSLKDAPHYDLSEKLDFLHTELLKEKPSYKDSGLDITKWDIDYRTDVPKQNNSYDCGAYVCFYMRYLRDIVPRKKVPYVVLEDFLRIWVANYIGDNHYNQHRNEILDGVRSFMQDDQKCEVFEKLYEHIPAVHMNKVRRAANLGPV